MLKNDDMINVYNDYDSELFAPSVDPRGNGLVFPVKTENDEPYIISILFSELRNLYRLDPNLLKKRILRIEKDQEEEVFKALNINIDRESEVFTREEIEDMILHPTNYVIETILSITSKQVIDNFLSQLVYLKNTNKYFIATKVEDYIRARKEEIYDGIRKSELEGMETENLKPQVNSEVDIAVLEERENIIKSKEEELTQKEKDLKDKEKKLKEEKKKLAEAKKSAKAK